jgi:hypothetical protein
MGKICYRSIFVGLSFYLITTLAYADPIINSASGSIVHKSGVSIYGTGFGTKTNAAPLRYDNFESGKIGSPLPGEQNNSGYMTTSSKGSAYLPSYSTTKIRYSGTQSAYQNFLDGNYSNYIRLTEPSLPSNMKRVYVSGWFNLVTGGAKSRNTKILNMGTASGWQTRVDVYPTNGSGHLYSSASCSGNGDTLQDWGVSAAKALLDDGNWHRVEGWLDLGTPNGNNGYRDIYMDLKKLGEISGTFIDSDCSLSYVSFGHYFATDTGSPRPWAQRYWDEIYVDTTRARVEIGNSPNWGSCTHREIQVPTSWSDGSIRVTINRGAFNAGERAYLFVVDASGAASGGYPVTIASGSGSTPVTVEEPNNLKVLPSTPN